MHDPTTPDDVPAPGASGDDEDMAFEAASKAIARMIAWYSQQLLRERSATTPDAARLERLKAEQRAALADNHALIDAEPHEVARLSAVYEARLKDLTET